MPGCLSQSGFGFRHEAKWGYHIDLMHLVPNVRRGGHKICMGNNAADAGVVDKDVKPTSPGHSLLHKPDDVSIIRQIGLDVRSFSQFSS